MLTLWRKRWLWSFGLLLGLGASACVLSNTVPCQNDADCPQYRVCEQTICVPQWFREKKEGSGLEPGGESGASKEAIQTDDTSAPDASSEAPRSEGPPEGKAETGPDTQPDASTPEPGQEPNTPEMPMERAPEKACPDACTLGEFRDCYPSGEAGCDLNSKSCEGTCKLGRQFCFLQQGCPAWSKCFDPGTPNKAERCDGKDDDCDGSVDEDFADKGKACDVGVGECKQSGKQICNTTQDSLVCDAKAGTPTAEICDAKDNDCNGQSDDNIFWNKLIPYTKGELQVHRVALDAQGNFYGCGDLFKDLQLGQFFIQNRGQADTLVFKLDPKGKPLWIRQIGGLGFEACGDLKLDKQNNVYVTGELLAPAPNQTSLVTFGSGANAKQVSVSGRRLYLSKLDTGGSFVGSPLVDRSTDSDSESGGSSIAVDSTGNIYLAGHFKKTISLPGSSALQTSHRALCISKWPASLTKPDWIHVSHFSTAHDLAPLYELSLVPNQPGHLYLLGSFWGELKLPNTTLKNQGERDLLLGELDKQGKFLWGTLAGGAGATVSPVNLVVRNRHIYVGGHASQTASFSGLGFKTQANSDAFIARFSLQSKKFDWLTQITSSQATNFSGTTSLAFFPGGTLLAVGYFESPSAILGTKTLSSNKPHPWLAYLDPATGQPQKVELPNAPNATETPPPSAKLEPKSGLIRLFGVLSASIQLGPHSFQPPDKAMYISSLHEKGVWACKP